MHYEIVTISFGLSNVIFKGTAIPKYPIPYILKVDLVNFQIICNNDWHKSPRKTLALMLLDDVSSSLISLALVFSGDVPQYCVCQ